MNGSSHPGTFDAERALEEMEAGRTVEYVRWLTNLSGERINRAAQCRIEDGYIYHRDYVNDKWDPWVEVFAGRTDLFVSLDRVDGGREYSSVSPGPENEAVPMQGHDLDSSALQAARDLITPVERWTRIEYARKAKSQKAHPSGPDACQWSLWGAILHAVGGDCARATRLGELVQDLIPTGRVLTRINDWDGHSAVLELLDRGVTHAKRLELPAVDQMSASTLPDMVAAPFGTAIELVRRDGCWRIRIPNCDDLDLSLLYDYFEAAGLWPQVRRNVPLMSGSDYLTAYRTEVDAEVGKRSEVPKPRRDAVLARMARVVPALHSRYQWLRLAESYVDTSAYMVARPDVYTRCPCGVADSEPSPDCVHCCGTGFENGAGEAWDALAKSRGTE